MTARGEPVDPLQDQHSIKEIMKSHGILDFQALPPSSRFIDAAEAIDEITSYDSFEPDEVSNVEPVPDEF